MVYVNDSLVITQFLLVLVLVEILTNRIRIVDEMLVVGLGRQSLVPVNLDVFGSTFSLNI